MDIFISYPAQSVDFARKLAQALRDKGASILLHAPDSKRGEDWKARTDRALREAEGVVVLFETGRRVDPSQQYELSAALESAWEDPSKRFIPLVIGGARLPTFLSGHSPLRVQKTSENWNGIAGQILRSLRQTRDFRHANRIPRPQERARRRNRLLEIKREAEALRPGR